MGLRGELGISTDRPFNKSCKVAAEPAWSVKGQKDSKDKQQQKVWILARRQYKRYTLVKSNDLERTF